ncbi:MAG: FAD-binding protein, partial [Bacteroidota bacterium]
AIDLLTEHSLRDPEGKTGEGLHCWGVYALGMETGRVDVFTSRATMLCTGGLGHVYLHTTNPPIATGDGVAMAHRAGARIANMEFIQFHPTALHASGSPSFLISEAVRGFGGVLRNRAGEEFMRRYDPRGSLAPRDVVAHAIDTELKRSGDDFVFLDVSHMPSGDVREHFPHIYTTCLEKFRRDMTREPLPVVPAAHYSCGGVVSDTDGRTSIGGLYAAGEVSMTGVHGANRLASNSLLEALVFSHRAALAAVADLNVREKNIPAMKDWDDSGTFDSDEWVLIAHDRREIQQIMWDYVGIVRSDLRLDRAHRRIQLIRDEIEAYYKRTRVTEGIIELRNLALCAWLIVRCAERRKESRGLHVNTDHPARDDAGFLKDTAAD